MGLYDKMQTSPRLESEGIWLEIDDTRMRLARAGGKNTKFIAAAEKIAREHKRSLDIMGEAQGRKLFGKLFAEIIVLDWLTKDEKGLLDDEGSSLTPEYTGDKYTRGISRPDGKIAEFNVENVMQTFDDLPDLLKIIKETAEDASLFRQSLLKDIEGN
jgi:hypothetical protein